MNWIADWYRIFKAVVNSLQSPLLLLVRLYFGWQFIQTGWGKLHALGHVTGYFAQLGIPFPHVTAIFVAWLEFIGGILLMAGLLSRVTALALTIDMIVAYVTGDHAALLSFFKDPGTFTSAAPFTFLAAALIVLIFGPGLFALDTLIVANTDRMRPF